MKPISTKWAGKIEQYVMKKYKLEKFRNELVCYRRSWKEKLTDLRNERNFSEMKMNQKSSWMSRHSKKDHKRNTWWKRTGENKSSKEIKEIHKVIRRSYMCMHINIWTLMIAPGDYLKKNKKKLLKMNICTIRVHCVLRKIETTATTETCSRPFKKKK